MYKNPALNKIIVRISESIMDYHTNTEKNQICKTGRRLLCNKSRDYRDNDGHITQW